MIKKKAVFKNLFSNHTITPDRLYAFGQFVYTALNNANTNGQYTAIVLELETILEALHIEISQVDRNLTVQVNSTRTVDEILTTFVEFMKDVEPVIARALGGRKSGGYLQFYPRTVTEYDKVNKSNIFLFTGRVYQLAETYSTALGDKLAGELQAFKGNFNEARSRQRRQITTITTNRNERNKYFTEAQWVLTAAVHYVAFINRSDEKASRSYFPFEMLYPKSRRKIQRLKGALDVLQTGELPHFDLITTACITIKNKSANAYLLVWIAGKDDGIAEPPSPLIVKALGTKKLKADMLKDIGGKRLLVKNSSTANKAYYEITVTGLKQQQTIDMDTEQLEQMKEEILPMVVAS